MCMESRGFAQKGLLSYVYEIERELGEEGLSESTLQWRKILPMLKSKNVGSVVILPWAATNKLIYGKH